MLSVIRIPEFNLYEPTSRKHFSDQSLPQEQCYVICFICNHCPFVTHIREQLINICLNYQSKNTFFMAINVNDPSQHPEDSPEHMAMYAKKFNYPFIYLYDESQNTAKHLGATCTPDFFVFDYKKRLKYHGRMDRSTPKNQIQNNGEDLQQAIDYVIDNPEGPALKEEKSSIGCSIKWKINHQL